MFRIHWGVPKFPTSLSAYTGTILYAGGGDTGSMHFTKHRIAKWYGVSFRLRWFVGFWKFGATTYPTYQGEYEREH